LLCKLVLAVVLVVPVGRLIGIHVEAVRRRAPAPAALDAARSFASLLHDVEVRLDEIERLRRAAPEQPGDAALDWEDPAGNTGGARETRAYVAVAAMEGGVAGVRTLFGSGRVSDAAIAALVAAHARLDAVSAESMKTDWARWRVDLGELDRARAEATLRA